VGCGPLYWYIDPIYMHNLDLSKKEDTDNKACHVVRLKPISVSQPSLFLLRTFSPGFRKLIHFLGDKQMFQDIVCCHWRFPAFLNWKAEELGAVFCTGKPQTRL
jgi:hypothetical protein